MKSVRRARASALSLVFAAALSVSVFGTASAAVHNLGSVPPAQFDSYSVGTGSFLDFVNFTLSMTGDLSAAAVNVNVGPFLDIAGFGWQLWSGSSGVGSQVIPVTFGSGDATFNSLSSGNYFLRITGTGTGSGGGLYTAAVAAVPEPGTWAMLLAGLAAVVVVSTRRVRAGMV